MQKLIYLAPGWHLGLTGEPLISDLVAAWTYGPVIMGLCDELKHHGEYPIFKPLAWWDEKAGQFSAQPPKFDVDKIPDAGDPPAASEQGRKFSIAALRNVRYDRQTRHYADEHAARLRLLTNLSTPLRAWLTFVAALLLLQGVLGESPAVAFRLGERELLAVLGVTTVNVLGVFLVAARYVLPGDPRWTGATHPGAKARRAR